MPADLPDTASMMAATQATWPAFATVPCGPFTLRQGRGAGRRVSAATAEGPVTRAQIEAAAQGMRDMGQEPTFWLPEGAGALDAQLIAAGFTGLLRTHFLAVQTRTIAALDLPRVGAFDLWPPLAIIEEIWASGGLGPERRAVIEAVRLPKTAVLSRVRDKPASALFVASRDEVAMVHALVTRPAMRRMGGARHAMIQAARWAESQGCRYLGLAVEAENAAALGLYDRLGFRRVGGYHYRMPGRA